MTRTVKARTFAAYLLPVAGTFLFSTTALSAASLVTTGTLGGMTSFIGGLSSGNNFSFSLQLPQFSLSSAGTTAAGLSSRSGDETLFYPFIYKNGGIVDLGLADGSYSLISGLSGDGSTVVGLFYESSFNDTHMFRWKNGTLTDLGEGEAVGVSANGNVIAANIRDNGSFGVRVENDILTTLDPLTGDDGSYAAAISADGSTIVGTSLSGNGNSAAFWRNGAVTSLGTLDTFNNYNANAFLASADGSVIGGYSPFSTDGSTYEYHAFRWENGVMTDLGTLQQGHDYAVPLALSADGSTLGGYSMDTSGNQNGPNNVSGVLWKNGTITDVGTLGGTIAAVTALSADGTVAAGISSTANNAAGAYFRWTQADGIQSIETLLANSNITYTGWDFNMPLDQNNGYTPEHGWSGIALSANGKVLAGNALYNGEYNVFLISLDSNGGGLITPEELAHSVATSTAQSSQQAQSSLTSTISQSLLAVTQAFSAFFSAAPPAAPKTASAGTGVSAGSSWTPQASNKAAYAIGSFGLGQNNDFGSYSGGGTTGMFLRVNPELAVGAGLLASGSHTELRLGGRSDIASYGGALHLAYEGTNNWRFYGTAGVSALDIDMRRHYMNGASVDSSRGSTDGVGYGAALRGGYAVRLKGGDTVMPYLQLDLSRTVLDGYTEAGGGIPATFGKRTSNTVISRLGAEMTHDVNTRFQLRGRGAWGHEVHANGNALTASALAVTTTVPYASGGDKNWLEGGVTGLWQLDSGASLMADVQAKAGKTAEPAIAATVGVTIGF